MDEGVPADDWFASHREPAGFAACALHSSPNMEHAFAGTGTLCGISADQVEVYRTLFRGGKAKACAECTDAAGSAPTRSSGQERLHAIVMRTVPGPVRDQLLRSLCEGATIELWINGPAGGLAAYVPAEDATGKGTAVRAALTGDGPASVARVNASGDRFVVVMRDGETPIVVLLDPL
jgi:hypothetical protein